MEALTKSNESKPSLRLVFQCSIYRQKLLNLPLYLLQVKLFLEFSWSENTWYEWVKNKMIGQCFSTFFAPRNHSQDENCPRYLPWLIRCLPSNWQCQFDNKLIFDWMLALLIWTSFWPPSMVCISVIHI